MRPLVPRLVLICAATVASAADDPPPRSLDPRLTIELFAEQPQLRTPTGIDVDARGRVWVIESNTHFRPEHYDGHSSDRLLILTDTDGDGRADDVQTFADGFQFAMSVALRPVWMEPIALQPNHSDPPDTATSTSIPAVTQVFLAERSGIWLLEDFDGDDRCDRRLRLVTLETEGNYPHNGLAGFAFDALGWMYFGLGENLGAPYTLVSRGSQELGGANASDAGGGDADESSQLSPLDSPLSGGGEGGNMYRMRPDGTQLSLWATGFWNPHASCIDAFGRLFTVDNDADSRPPCRLLHVVEGGDYGYRFRNGRRGLHPFTSWNGEIPGTLPMVAGTGEAPSGVLAYEHDALPEEYLGNLLVTSWGDHRIDRFRLKDKGASFESLAEPLVVGGENFRPVGIALAPDGSLYISDWVLADYNLHGKGRVWRVRSLEQPADARPQASIDETIGPLQYPFQLFSARLANRRWSARHLPEADAGLTYLKEVLPDARKDETPIGQRAAYETIASLVLTGETVDPLDDAMFSAQYQQQALRSSDPFAIQAVLRREQIGPSEVEAVAWVQSLDVPATASPLAQAHAVVRLRSRFPKSLLAPSTMLNATEVDLRRLAVQWAAEERLTDLRPQVEAVLKSEPMTTDLLLATLAALEMLDGKAPNQFDETPPGRYVLPLLSDSSTPAAVKAQVLRLVDPADPGLTVELLTSLLDSDDANLRLEAIRSLSASPLPAAAAPLAEIARRRLRRAAAVAVTSEADREELESLIGLAHQIQQSVARDTLLELLSGPLEFRSNVILALRQLATDDTSVRTQVLESAAATDSRSATARDLSAQIALIAASSPGPTANVPRTPATDDEWSAAITADEPDSSAHDAGSLARVQSGERLFFHPNGPRCYQCHTVNGRGGRIGPDLSRIGGAASPERLVDSILNPSKEVAPQFTNWAMVTRDGVTHTGMIVHENRGETTLGDAAGKTVTLKTIDIDLRTPLDASVMPEKLEERMTVQEFRDLVSFLKSLK